MDVLIEDQTRDASLMSRAFINLKKRAGQATRGTIQARLTALEQKWEEVQTRHRKILETKTRADDSKSYFKDDFLETNHEVFLDEKAKFLDALYALEPGPAGQPSADLQNASSTERKVTRRKLPAIDLPRFSGKYAEWTSFKDLFVALVVKDEYLEDVERLHYLKCSLTEEAANLIKNVPITAQNFDRAWARLISYYDNKRALVYSCLDTLFQLSPMQSESPEALKALRDGTSEAYETLQILERPVDQMDDFFVHITVRRFDAQTRRDWELSLGESMTPVTWKQLDTFLKTRIQALEMTLGTNSVSLSTPASQPKRQSSSQKKAQGKSAVTAHVASNQRPRTCSYCQGEHYIGSCEKFRASSLDDRSAFVSKTQLCYNCLGKHSSRDCRSRISCASCHGRHHTLLHRPSGGSQGSGTKVQPLNSPQQQTPKTGPSAANDSQPPPGVTTHATRAASAPRSILLATARLVASSTSQRASRIRSLIDPCSEASFISESLAQRLRLPRRSAFVPVTGVGATPSHTAKSEATVVISPHFPSDDSWKLRTLILPRLTDYLPSPQLFRPAPSFLEGLSLADPHLDSTDPIEMIVGADAYPMLIREGLRKTSDENTIAQATGLGWILTGSALTASGPSSRRRPLTSLQCLIDTDLSSLLERFWQQEEASSGPSLPLTAEELECESHFASTHRRNSDGRYVLRLPLKSTLSDLGNSQRAALSALLHTERRFANRPELKEKYTCFMTEYLSLGHMKETLLDNPTAQTSASFVLPHHGVFKQHGETSKLRVVFNGSVKMPVGLAINDCLHVGPKLQLDLFDILLRWRLHRYVFSADVQKMFRQILIDPEDHRFQRVLWRFSMDSPVLLFDLCTVTYGLASSPYQANRTLLQLACDEGERFPRAAQVVRQNRYVDDVCAGADTLEEASHLKLELIELLKAGGFPLSKWTANHPALLSDVPNEHKASGQHLTWHHTEAFQMLGVSWQPLLDAFCFQFTFHYSTNTVTKRTALSMIAQLFDPLGWISPVTISFKIFMQSLWSTSLQWDDPLPTLFRQKWTSLTESLSQLQFFSTPRWIGLSTNLGFAELHGFSDASERAFAACLYLRTVDKEGRVNSILLTSKSKVAPLKQVTLPRLELCGALLLVRLVNRVKTILSLEATACHLWSDSTITLAWIREPSLAWKTYVANRVSEIQTTLPQATWHHITGKDNPADLPSRGVTPRELVDSSLWLRGPSFLTSTAARWEKVSVRDFPDECPERRATACFVSATLPSELNLLTDCSTLNRLLRIAARCHEFLQRLRTQGGHRAEKSPKPQELTPAQLEYAFKSLIRYVQHLHFSTEIEAFTRNEPLPRKSSLIRLNPFLDEHGLLRVGGRLRHSLLHPDQKHPMILPRNSHLTRLLTLEAHAKTLHGGTQLTLNYLRQRFWVLRGRQLVKSIIFKCLRCWRHTAQPTTQLMGDLPFKRVQQNRPFLHSGVDYAGPIHLRLSKGRGTKRYKGYICVFVCLATRAVHLEVASGYSAADFLSAYRRFVARRGICASLTSDCGTNFVGADSELRRLFQQASAQCTDIARLLANDGTEWRFNPPGAPHFGGIWEAAVKSVKYHLRRIIGEALLTFEEMTTLLAQIEACLNSRPLHPLSDDPADLSALTPAHFLIGEPTLTVPEPSTLDISTPRLDRWQMIRQMYEHFWSRWSTEYLHELQQRPKWRTRQPQVKIGDLCLVRSELQPPCKWPLARIVKVQPGPDGLIRVVHVKTAASAFSRPISKISLLPSESDNCSPMLGEGGRDVAKTT